MLDQRLVRYWAHMLDECFVNESENSSAVKMSMSIQDYWWAHKTHIAPVICFGSIDDMGDLQYDRPTPREKRAIAYFKPEADSPGFFDRIQVAYAYCVRLDDDDEHAWVWQPWTTENDEVEFELSNMMMWDEYTSDEKPDPNAEYEHVREKFCLDDVNILDDEAVEQFIQDYCNGSVASPDRIAEIVYSLPGVESEIEKDVAAKMPSFYAGWLIPNEQNCRSQDERIKKTRSETSHTPEEILQWIADNKMQGDVVIPPVKYTYVNGKYQPETGKETIDTYFRGSVEPYRQIPKIRVKPMSASQRRHIQSMIVDPNYRRRKRAADNMYTASGRREYLHSLKTPDEIQRSKDNSKRRARLIQAVCKEFFPDKYEAWKHGKEKADRDQARAELVRLLDFTAGGENNLPDQALQVWRGIYDRFSAERKKIIQDIKDAYKRGDAEAVQTGVDRYNSLCRRYESEALNSDNVTQLIALDSHLFAPKTQQQLVSART